MPQPNTRDQREAEWSALMRAGLAGDAEAYRRLLALIAPVLRRMAQKSLSRAGNAEAEDVVQEILLAIHLKRQTWLADQPLTPWLNAIARHKLIDALRRRGRRSEVPIEDLADVLPDTSPDPESSPGELARLVGKLDGRQLDVVRAISIDGGGISDTAAKLGMSEGAVRGAASRVEEAGGALSRGGRQMKTERLIAVLATDRTPEPRPGRALSLALALGIAVAGVLFALTLGPRPDFLHAIETWRFVFKLVVTLILSASAFVIGLRMAYPMQSTPQRDLVLLVAPVLLAAAILVEMTTFPIRDWMPRLIGHNSRVCMSMIPVLSLAPLAALLWALRRGAPLNPLRAGAIAGLIAGGIGAAWYASHCPDDSPLFVAVWYTIGISIVTAIGAALGSRLLRW